MATLTNLISRVRFFIDEPTPQNWSDSDLTYAINRGQEAVAKEIVHIFEDYFQKQTSFNTVAGQELYPLTTAAGADFLKFKRLERTDTGEMVPFLDINEKIAYGTTLVSLATSNMGLSAYLEGNNLGLTPPPGSVIPLTSTYVYRLADLANGSDVSDIPAEWHDMMALYAAIDAIIKDEGNAVPLQNRWAEELNRMQRTIRSRQLQQPRQVRRVQSADYGVLW